MSSGALMSVRGTGLKNEGEFEEASDMNDYFNCTQDAWAPVVLPRNQDYVKGEIKKEPKIKSEHDVVIKTEGGVTDSRFEDADEERKKMFSNNSSPFFILLALIPLTSERGCQR
jgi:hypothetical protein